ncbi:hypothetical protein DSECCO2_483960 [anaerobic digester metagenome]
MLLVRLNPIDMSRSADDIGKLECEIPRTASKIYNAVTFLDAELIDVLTDLIPALAIGIVEEDEVFKKTEFLFGFMACALVVDEVIFQFKIIP